jgi:hypothetical protein
MVIEKHQKACETQSLKDLQGHISGIERNNIMEFRLREIDTSHCYSRVRKKENRGLRKRI